jgi:hypothetical protein
MRVKCADGPYVGQTFEFPYPRWMWDDSGHYVSQLYWISHGTNRHAYSLMENQDCGTFRLVYRDTF